MKKVIKVLRKKAIPSVKSKTIGTNKPILTSPAKEIEKIDDLLLISKRISLLRIALFLGLTNKTALLKKLQLERDKLLRERRKIEVKKLGENLAKIK